MQSKSRRFPGKEPAVSAASGCPASGPEEGIVVMLFVQGFLGDQVTVTGFVEQGIFTSLAVKLVCQV